MRTTIDINAELLRRAKKRAADESVSLRQIVERALQSFLVGRSGPIKPYKLKIGSSGGGLKPGVNFDDWNALRDLMDGIE